MQELVFGNIVLVNTSFPRNLRFPFALLQVACRFSSVSLCSLLKSSIQPKWVVSQFFKVEFDLHLAKAAEILLVLEFLKEVIILTMLQVLTVNNFMFVTRDLSDHNPV